MLKIESIFKELIKKGCNKDISKRYKVFMQQRIDFIKGNTSKTFKSVSDGIDYFNLIIEHNNFKGFCWDTITTNKGNDYFIILSPLKRK
jgi:hypothetical protein